MGMSVNIRNDLYNIRISISINQERAINKRRQAMDNEV